MNMVFTIAIPEDCSIIAIYNATAVAAGKDPALIKKYDCRHILVSKDIFDAYEAYMQRTGQRDSTGTYWLLFGPKVDDSLPASTVKIQEGFFSTIKK